MFILHYYYWSYYYYWRWYCFCLCHSSDARALFLQRTPVRTGYGSTYTSPRGSTPAQAVHGFPMPAESITGVLLARRSDLYRQDPPGNDRGHRRTDQRELRDLRVRDRDRECDPADHHEQMRRLRTARATFAQGLRVR